MRLSRLATVTTILALVGAGTSAAGAQVAPADLFRSPKAALAPATIASIAEGFNLSAAPLPTAIFTRNTPAAGARPRPRRCVDVLDEEIEAVLPASAPLPPQPVREASLKPVGACPKRAAGCAIRAAKAEAPVNDRAEARSSPPPPVRPPWPRRSNCRTARSSTGQRLFHRPLHPGGGFHPGRRRRRRLGGTLYLQRPGKIRFEYDPPATLEVIADGTSVAVRDKKLLTQDIYFIQQTPLKFLLRERVDLGGDIAITGITSEANSVRLNLEDRSTLGGTSRITLYFDPEVQNLTQWRIVDPQGSRPC